MRHFALTFIFALLGAYTASATDDITRILIYQINPTTRSIVEDIPEASISNDVLTVSFNGSGMYSLYIEDNFGVTVYTSALPANGMEYDYDLSALPPRHLRHLRRIRGLLHNPIIIINPLLSKRCTTTKLYFY